MIKGIGHLGIVVKDMEKSLKALSQVIEFQRPAIKEFPGKKMKCAVVETKGVSLEFIQDDSDDGLMARFSRGKGDAIHHFCLVSDNIEEDVEALKKRGVEMMDQKPRTRSAREKDCDDHAERFERYYDRAFRTVTVLLPVPDFLRSLPESDRYGKVCVIRKSF